MSEGQGKSTLFSPVLSLFCCGKVLDFMIKTLDSQKKH